MKRRIPLMLVVLSGLVLFAAPARSAVVTNGPAVWIDSVLFETYLAPVTEDTTPEWAKLPHVQAWYEIRIGMLIGGGEGTLLVLRGLWFTSGQPYLCQGALPVHIFSLVSLTDSVPGADTPEPSCGPLFAVGLLLVLVLRRRALDRG